MSDRDKNQRNQKREQFANAPRGGSHANKIIAAVTVILVGLVMYMAFGRGTGSSSLTEVKPVVGELPGGQSEREVKIRLADLGPEAMFYEYKAASGQVVRFFAMRSSDGVYRAAADTCDVCFRSKKGYRQEGDDMVCNNCNQRFPSALVNEVRGGCNPSGIDQHVDGGNMVISVAELERQAAYF